MANIFKDEDGEVEVEVEAGVDMEVDGSTADNGLLSGNFYTYLTSEILDLGI